MELDQLRQLLAIQTHGTLSAAAKEVSISQPALSRSMQRLEHELGTPLFEREHNRLRFNDAGHVAAAHAEAVLNEVQLLRDAVDEQSRRSRALRVGTCAPAPLWNLTARIIERFPTDVFRSETLSEKEIEQRVLNASLDFGISRKPCSLPVISNFMLMTETVSIAVPPDHPLAQHTSVTFDDLAGVDFLLLENIGVWSDFHARYMPQAHFFVQNDSEVYSQQARAGNLAIFVTDAPTQLELFPERIRIPIDEPQATATFYLLTRTDAPKRVQQIMAWLNRAA